MEIDEEIVLSCLICESANQDKDFVCLYLKDEQKLSEAGMLYEELLGIKIIAELKHYPKYLCNSCDKQMKLFKKLKLRALKTLTLLKEKYRNLQQKVQETTITESLEEIENDMGGTDNMLYTTEHSEEENSNVVLSDETILQELKDLYEDEIIEKEDQMVDAVEKGEEDELVNETEEIFVVYDENSLSDVSIANDSVYTDIFYLDESNENNSTKNSSKHKRKKYKCNTCAMDFDEHSELTKHRKVEHLTKFACPKCPKLLQTLDSLRVHLQLHQGLPAYKCDICQKTFNQKVHYKYHIDKHNNVRNFKCEECEKAYISKADLAIHQRTHTRDHRHRCDICGKDYLLYQHLKMHRYSHFEKSFECEICQQKFTSPLSLNTHVKTIHILEPRFQCEFCARKFRRKHHLIAHHKVHQKHNLDSDDNILLVDDDDEIESEVGGVKKFVNIG